MKFSLIYRYRWHILLLLFGLNLFLVWPGFIQPDSQVQYAQAVAAKYSDHHPPLMSFVWHYLDLIHQGEGLMFVLQLAFLYGALAIFLAIIDQLFASDQRFFPTLLLLLLPVYPQVLVYSANIVKDVQYAFSFLLVAAMLSYYTITDRTPKWPVLGFTVLLMIYGAAVKYQGQFCVSIFALWLGCLLFVQKKLWQKMLAGAVIYGLVFGSIVGLNSLLVPQQSKNYSWQYVKLYDLAAMSRGLQQDLIPDFNKLPAYTFQKLDQRFKYPTVDPYIYSEDNIFTVTTDVAQMEQLYKTWLENITTHPFLYLKHRSINMCYALLSRPGFDYATNLMHKFPAEGMIFAVLNLGVSAIFYVFMSHFLTIGLGFIYLFWGMLNWRISKAAPILIGLASLALSMVGILFFMSMAGVPRYTYMSIILIHAGHIFAYKCLLDWRSRNAYNTEAQSKVREFNFAT